MHNYQNYEHEVQASVWDAATREACEKAGIPLL